MWFMQNNLPQQNNFTALTQQIKLWGVELGFQAVGISDIELTAAEDNLQRWLDDGYHGTMDYMAKHGNKRSRPEVLVPGTLRVISVRMNYLPDFAKDSWEVIEDGEKAYISRYALGRDYHKVMRNRLEILSRKICTMAPEAQCRVFTDSAPVQEVALAEKAFLGWRGKHTLLLSRDHGSYFFLGEIYTNLPLILDRELSDLPQKSNKNHCGSCTSCIDICPTQAIIAPYQVDARRCISYLTIELKGSVPEALRGGIGNRIYGCDDCQLVCPWNRFAQISLETDYAIRHRLDNVTLVDLFAWEEEEFLKKFAGSAIYRIGYEQWLRNIAIALGNAPTSKHVLCALQARINHPSAVVKEHVLWALKQHKEAN
jgi:epoxyqueuosine reductase